MVNSIMTAGAVGAVYCIAPYNPPLAATILNVAAIASLMSTN